MNRGKEPYAVGYRRLSCHWCRIATVHDTHKFWLRCHTCQRCYSCGEGLRCSHCLKYEEAVAKERDGVMSLDWLDTALKWIKAGI